MKQQKVLWLLVATLVVPQAGFAQGMVEQGGMYSGVAGLGAGLAAGGRVHADTLKRSFEAVGRAQQAVQQSVAEQTDIIQKNMKLGCQFEAAKEWQNAENAFKWVLQGVAHRDGPGSSAAVPALKHLVTISEAQNKLDDAIGFQKTVTAFSKVAKQADPSVLAAEQIRLCNLYFEKGDYSTAEPILREMVENPNTSIPAEQRCTALNDYCEVLHKLNKKPYIAPEVTAQEQPKRNEVTAPSEVITTAEASKAEATELLDYVNNTILRQRTALLSSPHTAVLEGQDILPEKNQTPPGEGKAAVKE